MVDPVTSKARRRFLKFLAASPLLSCTGLLPGWMEAVLHASGNQLASIAGSQEAADAVISSVREAVEVMDFEAVARRNLLPQHWGYLVTSVDDDAMLRVNREGFARFQIRVRRLVDFSKLDTSVQLFGVRWRAPITLCPVASLKGFHTEGETGVAKAARSKQALMMLSTVGSTAVEEVNEARGEPVWFQLYARPDWENTVKLVKRVEAAGCPVLVLTVDLLGGRNTPTLRRALGLEGTRAAFCQNCHEHRPEYAKPMVRGLMPAPGAARSPLAWDSVKRLRDSTSMKLVLKGIVTREDAELAVAHGTDGVMVSNHGGRAEASGRSTIESLPEVAAGVAGRIPIILDSGIRYGTDIFKAFALGATAVGIGRPYVWGLAGFGQEGVEAVLDILTRELELVMRQTGVTSVEQISRGRYVVDRFGAVLPSGG